MLFILSKDIHIKNEIPSLYNALISDNVNKKRGGKRAMLAGRVLVQGGGGSKHDEDMVAEQQFQREVCFAMAQCCSMTWNIQTSILIITRHNVRSHSQSVNPPCIWTW